LVHGVIIFLPHFNVSYLVWFVNGEEGERKKALLFVTKYCKRFENVIDYIYRIPLFMCGGNI